MKTNKYKQITPDQEARITKLFDGGNIKFSQSILGYDIEISQMYSYVKFKNMSVLQGFQAISKILDCINGDERDRYYESGCETCDYGSKYSYSLRFW